VLPLFQSGIRSTNVTLLVFIWMKVKQEPILEKDGTL